MPPAFQSSSPRRRDFLAAAAGGLAAALPPARAGGAPSSYPAPDWPADRIVPRFPPPAATLDAIDRRDLSADERILFSSLQGRVNLARPRILLLDGRAAEGRDTWADTPAVGLGPRTIYTREDRFDLFAKYAGELAGAVLYDPEESPHHRNLAGTAAALVNAVPVAADVHGELKARGLGLPVLEDLRGVPARSAVAVYELLYESYWPRCSKRVILSARPGRRGDHDHARDLAAAAGAAVVWLDGRVPAERALLQRFLSDMTPGDAVLLGWHATERSGVTAASACGVGTVPADFYVSGSVYAAAGAGAAVRPPAAPPAPALENRAYVAVFISDGDNVQYNQHEMRRVWDRSAPDRGRVPLTWTVSPALVDLGPGLLQYYYDTATPADCFACGPSGLGYLMPVNTLNEPGAPAGVYTPPAALEGYAKLTERYLKRSGLRVLTVWDDLTEEHRAIYAEHCPSLSGVTVQNFRDDPTVAGGVTGGLRFEKLAIPYCTTEEHLVRVLERRLDDWPGDGPLFTAFQINVWERLRPGRLADMAGRLAEKYAGRVRFVRGDHYFDLRAAAEEI